MKKLLIIALLSISTLTKAQSVLVDGTDINAMDISYCELVGYNTGAFTKKLNVYVDYGQKNKLGVEVVITDANKKPILFNSMIDALNFMNKNGWEFESTYAVNDAGLGSVYHYLLKRKK